MKEVSLYKNRWFKSQLTDHAAERRAVFTKHVFNKRTKIHFDKNDRASPSKEWPIFNEGNIVRRRSKYALLYVLRTTITSYNIVLICVRKSIKEVHEFVFVDENYGLHTTVCDPIHWLRFTLLRICQNYP